MNKDRKMKNKYLLLSFLVLICLSQGCSKKESEITTPFFTSFPITQRLIDSKTVSFDLKIYFDSNVQLSHALNHRDTFYHAVSMTMQKYSLDQIKGKKLKILVHDILNQVFRGHAVNFEILNLKY